MHFRYETAGLVAVTRSMDIAVAYVIQVLIHIQTLLGFMMLIHRVLSTGFWGCP
jgi:hypothetical protein